MLKRALHLTTAAVLSIASFVTLSLTARDASAQATGFAINRFDPSERGSEWFALESLDLRGHARPALGLVLDWGYRPLALYKQDGSVDKAIVEHQVFVHAGGSIVLWERLRLGVNAPLALYQTGEAGTLAATNTTFAPPDSPSFGDVRVGGDVRLVGEYGDVFTLAFGTHVYLPSGQRKNYTGDETVRVQPRVVAAGDIGPLVYAARVAVQYRPDDRGFGAGKLGSEMLFAGALGLRVADKKLVIGPELFGSTVLGEAFDKLSSPLEGIFGGHYTAGDVRLGLGAGGGFTRGFGSPVSRVLASLEWAPQIDKDNDRDKDGILDKEDACPDVPGVRTDDPKTNGCPAEGDRDHDGILDKDDACPDVPGVRTDDPKTNGCPPDRDHDGILDKDDACPDVPGVKTDDPKTNGCPPDRDHDGIVDRDDACPDTPGVKTSDPKTNGCPPDPDRDKDGILNEVDACPDEPGKPDPDPKKNGCPKAFISGGQIKILDQVKFATGSAQIVKGAKDSEEVLDAVLKVLNDHPELKKVRIEGHTDNRGSAELNKKLSGDRAASVVKWLTAKGVDGGRLTSQGFGPDRPIDTNNTDQGRQNNRRVEFHIETETPKP